MSTVPVAESFMSTKLVTLSPTMDIYEGILKMMKHEVSGAPVVEEDGTLVGMLSEKDCMSIFASAAYSDLPGGTVAEYMIMHPETIGLKTDLFTVAGILMHRPYRRLPVVDGAILKGIVSRPDVLRASIDLWQHPDGHDWTDSKYLTPELKALLKKK